MYTPIGYKWGSSADFGTTGGVVEWSVAPGTFSSLPQTSGYSDSDFDHALTEAFEIWESVASIDFQRVSSGGDINIIDAPTTGDVIGYATHADTNGDNIADASTIAFSNNLSNFSGDWAPFGEGGINFFVVALHEIGHSIGLDHVEGSLQIMNSILTPDLTNLLDGDIEGAQAIYGKDPGDVDVAPEPETVDRDTSTIPLSDDGGGGGGGILMVLLGVLALLFGGLFGGGGAVVAAAARYDEGDDTDGADEPAMDVLLSDLLPTLEDHGAHGEDGIHLVRWDEGDDEDAMPFLL